MEWVVDKDNNRLLRVKNVDTLFTSVPEYDTPPYQSSFARTKLEARHVIPFSELQRNDVIEKILEENELLRNRITELESWVDSKNKTDEEFKRKLADITETVRKNKISTEDALALIISMFEKKDEETKNYNPQLLKEFELSLKFIRWEKRLQEDEAKDVEK